MFPWVQQARIPKASFYLAEQIIAATSLKRGLYNSSVKPEAVQEYMTARYF